METPASLPMPGLLLDRPDEIRALRKGLDAAGYTHAAVLEALGLTGVTLLYGKDIPVLMRLTRDETPLNLLVRLFLMDVPVPVGTARRLLSPGTTGLLIAAGLAGAEGGRLVPRLKLLPYEGLLIAFDSMNRLEEGETPDYVMGVGKSTMTLARLTIRRPCRATLDLGAGCGFQALLAARHSERVAASDVNPRAVRLATFNAAVNDLPRIECLEGDLFEPVAGRRFDLIVSNPPYVISPDRKYVYRDSGLSGDSVCRKIVREAPAHLAEGGFCQVLGNWAVRKGEDWRKNLEAWFDGSGCDAWILCSETVEAGVYAWRWIRHTEFRGAERCGAQYEDWMAYYEREGIEAVCLGYLMMRKRSGAANWFFADDAPEEPADGAGDDVLRGFALRDFLQEAKDDGAILRRAYRPSPHLSITSCRGPGASGWEEKTLRIGLERGLVSRGNIDRIVEGLITRCDGRRPLAEILREVASAFGVAQGTLDAPAAGIVRGLVERGFLRPAVPEID